MQRVLLKLSGESLAGDAKTGISGAILQRFVDEIGVAVRNGMQIGIVVGGGNIFRGLSHEGQKFNRVTADQMGMLATVINGLALGDFLLQAGIPAKVLTAVEMGPVGERFRAGKAVEYLEDNNVVIIAGGTGNPFFTTDTAAVLRAVEIKADAILKGTRVDGVYDADPEKNPSATKYDKLTYLKAITDDLKVMDLTAISLARENRLKIIVFNIEKEGNFVKLANGEKIGTTVED